MYLLMNHSSRHNCQSHFRNKFRTFVSSTFFSWPIRIMTLPSPTITPSGSPISPHKRLINHTELNDAKRRRKSQPHRAPEPQDDQDKLSQGIVQLDVYSMFIKNPSKLLYTHSAYPSPSHSRKSDGPASPADSKSLFRGQKSIPEEVKHGVRLDMEYFKDTEGAPTVQWKGMEWSVRLSSLLTLKQDPHLNFLQIPR